MAKTFLVEKQGGGRGGPFTVRELEGQFLRGEIEDKTQVCEVGGSKWQPYSDVRLNALNTRKNSIGCIGAIIVLIALFCGFEWFAMSQTRSQLLRLELIETIRNQRAAEAASVVITGRGSVEEVYSRHDAKIAGIMAEVSDYAAKQRLFGIGSLALAAIGVGFFGVALKAKQTALPPPPSALAAAATPPAVPAVPALVSKPATPPILPAVSATVPQHAAALTTITNSPPTPGAAREPKGACYHCGTHIAFPRAMEGQLIECPSCGQETALLDTMSNPTNEGEAKTRKHICEHCKTQMDYSISQIGVTTECPHCNASVILGTRGQSMPGSQSSATASSRGSAFGKLASIAVIAVFAIVAIAGIKAFQLRSAGRKSSERPTGQNGENLETSPKAEKQTETKEAYPFTYEEAMKRAKQGDAKGQLNLGVRYYFGDGVRQDYSEAVRWFQMAAEQGEPKAQFNLGVCYRDGTGVEKDTVKRLQLFRAAAEQNHGGAQCEIADAYNDGKGVPQDEKEALKWYVKAGFNKDSRAAYILGLRYRYNPGGPKDFVESYAWFSQCDKQQQSKAPKMIEELEEYMTKEQIIAGKKRAEELRLEIAARAKGE